LATLSPKAFLIATYLRK